MRRRRQFGVAVLGVLALALLLGGTRPARAAMVFVAGSGNEFGTIDLTTGAFTQIGTFSSLPPGVNMFGMGFGADGNLYGLDSENPAVLYRINTANAQLTTISAINHSAIDATADASGKLYALSQDSNAVFYTMTPPSTTTTVVGSTGIFATGLAAVTANGSAFYAGSFDNTTGDTDFNSVNLTTGSATLIGDTGFANVLNGLFVQGTLYSFDSAGDILTINTTTGAGTKVGTYSLPNGDAILASSIIQAPLASAVPEPASLTLLGLGALGLLGYGWRKRKQAAEA
jgi:hypothetical protein